MAILSDTHPPHAYDLTVSAQSGPTLVFVHGWLLSRRYWQPMVERLSPRHPCLTYDMRGFGDSQAIAPTPITLESPPQQYTLAAYAEDLAALLAHLNLEQVWIIGHSLGGSVALWAAHLFPDQVQGVICINAGGGIYLKEEFERFRAAGQQLVKFRPRWLSQMPLLDYVFARANVAHPVERRWGRQRLIDFVAADADAALGALLDSTTEAEVHRLPQVVAQLRQPVHFIAGAADTVMEPKYVRHLASFHASFEPQGQNVTEIPDCGHLAMIEHPDQVVKIIDQVLMQASQSD